MKPAVVVSAFTPGLAVIRSLARRGVPVVVAQYDDRDVGQVSNHRTELVRVPHPEQAEERFVERLIALAPRYDRAVLIPATDAALAGVSRNKGLLEQHYLVACPDWAVAQQVLQKERTYAAAERAGVAAPKTEVPRSLEAAERYAAASTYPVLVKPSQGHLFKAAFDKKMVEVHGPDELLHWYREASGVGFDVMLQEIIPGEDPMGANYNSYTWEGEPLVEFTARKVRGSPPVYGSPRVALSVDLPDVAEAGRALLRELGYSGFACTEFKQDARTGRWTLMEVNGRHNLSGMLAIACGVDFPWLEYRHIAEGVVPEQPVQRRNIYWIDIVRDMGCNVLYAGREPYRLRDYVRPYLRPHVFAIWDPHDPKPLLMRCWNVARGGIQAILGRLNPSRTPPPLGDPPRVPIDRS